MSTLKCFNIVNLTISLDADLVVLFPDQDTLEIII